MAAGVAWQGIQEVLGDARAHIDETIQKLQDQGKEEMTVVVLGKKSVGKSSTVNTLLGEPGVRPVEAFQANPDRRVAEIRRSVGSFTLRVFDTPALVDCGMVDTEALQGVVSMLVGRTVDVLLLVDRLDAYRVEAMDRQLAAAVSSYFGRKVWRHAVLVLTHAQMSLPDNRNFDQFAADRSAPLCDLIRQEGRLGKSHQVPVAVVENVVSRWRRNADEERILPNGQVWFGPFLEAVLSAATQKDAVKVTERMVAGPNVNNQSKWFIPFMIAIQYFLIFRPMRKAIEFDKSQADRRRPTWEVEAEAYRRSNAAAMARRRIAQHRQQQAQKAQK